MSQTVLSIEEVNTVCDEREKNYYKEAEHYYCKKCGSQILAKAVYHSIHDGYSLFKKHAGSGRVEMSYYPYCLKCEGEPKNISEYGECIDL